MSLFVILALAIVALLVLAVVVGWVDSRRRREQSAPAAYVERERQLW